MQCIYAAFQTWRYRRAEDHFDKLKLKWRREDLEFFHKLKRKTLRNFMFRLVSLSDLADPVEIVRHSNVNAGYIDLSTSNTPERDEIN